MKSTIVDYRDKFLEGIMPYAHEREVLLRLLRKRGSFTSKEFDEWFTDREFRRKIKIRFYDRGSFILGCSDIGRTYRDEILALLQIMITIGDVSVEKGGDRVVYRPMYVTDSPEPDGVGPELGDMVTDTVPGSGES